MDERFKTRYPRRQKATYQSALNFEESLREPLHRWFRYKEGFSPQFVRDLLTRYPIPQGAAVLDTFCGVGTTLVEARTRNHRCIGFEVNPFAAFVARLKSCYWTSSQKQDLDQVIRVLQNASPCLAADPPNNSTVVSYFQADVLHALLSWKHWGLTNIDPGIVSDAFKLAWLYASERLCSAYKAGNGLKRRKGRMEQPLLPSMINSQVRELMVEVLTSIQDDLAVANYPVSGTVIEDSALSLATFVTEPVGICITSPPYANCFDYTKIYLCELWLGDFVCTPEHQREVRSKSLRSHVHFSWENRGNLAPLPLLTQQILPGLSELELWSNKIPTMLSGYFSDLFELLQQMNKVMVSGSVAAFAVSNPVYGGLPIAVDLLLSQLGIETGFESLGVEVDRTIIPSSQQYVRLGGNASYARESTVLLRRV